tara:strand:+ start:1664 stop:1936 length:273 start_codon:yes stop_codon:yes gene_type:complete
MSDTLNQEFIIDLNRKLDRLCSGIEVVKDRQEEMVEDVSKIKEAVYDPDEGLYARIRALESWKSTSTKLLWTLFTAMIGLGSAFILKTYG